MVYFRQPLHIFCCMQFVSLRNLQNVLCDLAKVQIRVMVRFQSEICKLHMHYFEIVQQILQIAQIDKSPATFSQPLNLMICIS